MFGYHGFQISTELPILKFTKPILTIFVGIPVCMCICIYLT